MLTCIFSAISTITADDYQLIHSFIRYAETAHETYTKYTKNSKSKKNTKAFTLIATAVAEVVV